MAISWLHAQIATILSLNTHTYLSTNLFFSVTWKHNGYVRVLICFAGTTKCRTLDPSESKCKDCKPILTVVEEWQMGIHSSAGVCSACASIRLPRVKSKSDLGIINILHNEKFTMKLVSNLPLFESLKRRPFSNQASRILYYSIMRAISGINP